MGKLKTMFSILLLSLITLGPLDLKASNIPSDHIEPNFLDSEEYDPADPNIEEILKKYDEYYFQNTGINPWLVQPTLFQAAVDATACYQEGCAVFIHVKKSEQKAYLYLNGKIAATWLVSTGAQGHGTPDFNQNPNGRIYQKYSSNTYPGGDYKGLGNMPYAVFISGGFAIHGTPESNWKYLGKRASHGCIRVHPDNGRYFNELVRKVGIKNTWITVN